MKFCTGFYSLALGQHIAKHLSVLNRFLLSNNKNYRLRKRGVEINVK